jgi:hypothetical protein
MSGSGSRYTALDRTLREVEFGRDGGSPRNYDALRQTHQQVSDEPQPSSPTQERGAEQPHQNPYEHADERIAAHSQQLQARVDAGQISPGEKVDFERRFDNELASEMMKYDQGLAEARELAASVNARLADDQQKTISRGPELER